MRSVSHLFCIRACGHVAVVIFGKTRIELNTKLAG